MTADKDSTSSHGTAQTERAVESQEPLAANNQNIVWHAVARAVRALVIHNDDLRRWSLDFGNHLVYKLSDARSLVVSWNDYRNTHHINARLAIVTIATIAQRPQLATKPGVGPR